MANCNKLVKAAFNGELKPCLCVFGHAGGCNPFSPNPYMAVVMAKKDLPKGDRMPLPIVTPQLTPQPEGVIWTDKSTNRRCLWQGAHGRCIYELGNHTQHKEEQKSA
jgi:hypothetical protein